MKISQFASKILISHRLSIVFLIFVVVANKYLNSKINFISIFVIAKKLSNITFLLEILLSIEKNFKIFFNVVLIIYIIN